jgi:hypothetical protein
VVLLQVVRLDAIPEEWFLGLSAYHPLFIGKHSKDEKAKTDCRLEATGEVGKRIIG